MIDGKPLFETEDRSGDNQSEGLGHPQVQATGPKVIPRIEVERTHVHNQGDRMEVRCEIRNHSGIEIELDKIRIAGAVRELDTRLRPGESKDFIVYSGKRPNNQSYGVAELNYKDLLGDYFQAKCAVEYRPESDNTYSVNRIRVAGPIKDIE